MAQQIPNPSSVLPDQANGVDLRLQDEFCPDLIFGLDATLCLNYANATMTRLAAMPIQFLLGLNIDQLGSILGEDLVSAIAEVQRHASSRRIQISPALAGVAYWFDVWIVARQSGEVACFARDITEMKHVEAHLRASADHDSLTGLLNHATFHNEVSRALSQFSGEDLALVLFDLDYLKLINDMHGHLSGDRALQQVAVALRATTREVDHIARLGGDEFGALLVGTEREQVVRIAERVVAQVRASVLPVVGRLSISAGIAFVGSVREPGDLFDRADTAVYVAKTRGRGVVSIADAIETNPASRKDQASPALPGPHLSNARDLVSAARGALREWVSVLACSGGCVDLLDEQATYVKAIAYFRFGHDDWALSDQVYLLADYPSTAEVLARGQPYTCQVGDPESDPAEASLLRGRGFASSLITPLSAAGRSIGIIEMFDTRPRTFTTSDQRVAMALAHHLAPLLALLQEQDQA